VNKRQRKKWLKKQIENGTPLSMKLKMKQVGENFRIDLKIEPVERWSCRIS